MSNLLTRLTRTGCYATLALVGLTPAWAQEAPRLVAPPANQAYGFAYRFTGNPRAYPVQAFRGRHALYVQYPRTMHPRRAWVWRRHGYRRALLVHEGPYYAIAPIAARTKILTGHGAAVVWAANAVPGAQRPTPHTLRVVRIPPTGTPRGSGAQAGLSHKSIATRAMATKPVATRTMATRTQAPTPPRTRVMMLRAQRLSRNLRRFLGHHHWHLAWRSAQDYAVPYPYVLRGRNTLAILRQLAHLYNLRIHIYHGNRVVVVTIANPLTRRFPHAH